MQDIKTRSDIEFLLQKFYEKALVDEKIGFFFTEIVQLNLETHLPKLADFWENILLQTNVYKGNPIPVHLDLHEKSPISAEHFERWVSLFLQTVDTHFEGEVAERAKQRAQSIATVMQIKLSGSFLG